ncbi:restriction endonuclease subunit S (plasmid) [Lactococcus cremoris]|uniref:restriction endonuclease subunit S n=2 Tax=Lactococcus lactis subsp. cremoris TaxID=1359 RepID=UPI00248E6647|nr:restriction endonuclease subunit S [Lactococcus cremoris]WGU43781.1 restriction endonuclease subunit S [Lactococcus cremoris]
MAKIDDSVKKKVPELRFPGFTYDWEERKLSDIADRFDNLRVPITASDRKPGDTPYYGANGIQDYVEGFTHNGEFILVAEDGANDLKNYPVQYVNGKVWVNNHAHVLQGKKTITDNKFLMNAIKNFNIEPFLVGGGRAKLNADVMMKLNILLPTFVEQEKIGSLFSLLDKTIALHQRKLDLLKEQKKGYLQKMFPKNGAKVPELRFAGFADDWEERKLGDITKISTGKLDANAMVENGKYDFYTSGIKKYRIDVAAFEGPSITIAGNGATVGYMHLADNKFNAYQRTYVLQEFLVDRSFIFSEIGNKLPKKIKQEARTGNIPYIVMDMLTELKLSIPQNNSEQQKIGSFFKQLDDTIDLHQRKLDLLKEQKKGFLQKMFV